MISELEASSADAAEAAEVPTAKFPPHRRRRPAARRAGTPASQDHHVAAHGRHRPACHLRSSQASSASVSHFTWLCVPRETFVRRSRPSSSSSARRPRPRPPRSATRQRDAYLNRRLSKRPLPASAASSPDDRAAAGRAVSSPGRTAPPPASSGPLRPTATRPARSDPEPDRHHVRQDSLPPRRRHCPRRRTAGHIHDHLSSSR